MKYASVLRTTLLLALLCAACGHPCLYDEYRKTDATGWSQDSAAVFTVQITDTLRSYDLLLHIRHDSHYPYQNFWLFAQSCTPDSVCRTDTLECYLADNRGRWLGQDYFSYYEMPLLYMQNIRFPRPGAYRFAVYHAMRDSLLPGIHYMGLQVEPHTESTEDGQE